MKVGEICTREVNFCRPESDLAAAAALMRDVDRGALPVVDARDRLVGVVTDRDVCMAVAARKGMAAETPVRDVMSGKVVSCKPGDSARDALKLMRDAQLRRLPVVDDTGKLEGMVTVNDIIVAADNLKSRAEKDKMLREIMVTLMAISQLRPERGLAPAEPRTMTR